MDNLKQLESMSREDLIKLLQVFAKNWLAHDGCWFLAVEDKYDLDTAIECDTAAWYRFAPLEAKRIMSVLDLKPGGGLKALERVLQFRQYAVINRQAVEWIDERTMVFKMIDCRVQQARRHKELPDFPCKPVGKVEFSRFAQAVDPRIHTACIACPPDAVDDFFCAWQF
ncbi:MAG: DUF6125 family protein, partial [Candidatus Latescibacterota bacterium]